MSASDCFPFALARLAAAAQPAHWLGAAVAKHSAETSADTSADTDWAGIRDGLHASAFAPLLPRVFALSANL